VRIVKIIYSYYFEHLGGAKGRYAYVGGIVAYLLTEIDLGTGSGHFESID
jgi:hypothetical protein